MQTRSEKGFTLTELIVTMVIVAAMAAVGIPLFFDVQTFHDRGFHDTVLSTVRYAQKHAVATGCTVEVEIIGTQITLSRADILANCNAGPYDTELTDPSGVAPTFVRTAPAGVILTTTVATFTFDSLGRASADVTVTVGGRSFQVIAETGFVQRI